MVPGMSIVQYLVALDALLAAWRKLRETECRLVALWNELSPSDQERLLGWAREHGLSVLHVRA